MWLDRGGDYDYGIPSHPGEVNIVGGTLVSAEWVSLSGELCLCKVVLILTL